MYQEIWISCTMDWRLTRLNPRNKKKKQTYRGGEAVALDGRRNMQIVLLYIVFILGS